MRTFIIKWLRKWGFYGTLDSEKAIRALKTENNRLKEENERLQGFQVVYIDPTVRQRGYQQSAWNSPERNTDPFTERQRRGIPDIRTQHELPKMPRKYTMSRYSGAYPGETEHRTPAFLKDRKIS